MNESQVSVIDHGGYGVSSAWIYRGAAPAQGDWIEIEMRDDRSTTRMTVKVLAVFPDGTISAQKAT